MKTVMIDDFGMQPLVQAELRDRTLPMLFDNQGVKVDPKSFPVYEIAMAHRSSPSAHALHIQNAYIYNDVVFTVDGVGLFEPLPSSWRPEERPARGSDFLIRATRAYADGAVHEIKEGFFIGSAGSSNYGHWLVDDFPRGVVARNIIRSIPIIYTSFSSIIDAIKVETLNMLRPLADHILVDRLELVFVHDLFLVEPISRHPLNKSRASIGAMTDFVKAPDDQPKRKIFINRRAGSRSVTNASELATWLDLNGYESVYPEDFDFITQVGIFRNTSSVLGIMGAAMTNIVFCPPGTPILFLAPSGWDEPFYWDLCDTLGLAYAVMYGDRINAPDLSRHLSDFHVNIDALTRVVNEARPFSKRTPHLSKKETINMERHEVIQSALSLFESPRYLEIGVNQGHTFHLVKASEKVGVDPNYLFDVEAARIEHPENSYNIQTSDQYFCETLGKREPFDVIFIDGLHCFDQVLRDFINSTELLSKKGVIIIDDVMPRDFVSSLPSIDMMFAMRKAANSADATWMGDVYKLVFYIAGFISAFSYATVEENHGQTICWRQARPLIPFTMAQIMGLNYTDVVLGKKILNIMPHGAIMQKINDCFKES